MIIRKHRLLEGVQNMQVLQHSKKSKLWDSEKKKKVSLPPIYPTNVIVEMFAKDYWRQFSTVESNWLLKSQMAPNMVV